MPSEPGNVLLVLRTPPPYGGGEMVGLHLESAFRGTYGILAFRRGGHRKALQGKLSASNLAFGLRYIGATCLRLLSRRPRVLYIDLPKDVPSFLRASVIVLVALALRVRVIGDLAGADFPFLAGRGLTRSYAHALLRRVHRIRVLGEQVRETLAGHGLSNVAVVPNGIAEPPGAAAAAAARALGESPGFLYVGKVSRSKGIFVLLEFVRDAASAGRQVRLDVVGEWEDAATEREARALVAAAGIGADVHFHGLLVGDEKWERYRRADLLLHPSSWDGQPVTILEAFAFGLPVVASRVGAIPDTVRPGVDGQLLDEITAEALAAGVVEATGDAARYRALAANARRSFVERYEISRFTSAMGELIEDTARTERGRDANRA